MSLDIGVPGGTGGDAGFDVRRASSGLHVGVGAMLGGSAIFGMHRDSNSSLINVFPVASLGWTVYKFLDSASFTLRPRTMVRADVQRIGGGGSGGGGIEGGGGGAGQVLDERDVELVAGEYDEAVIVGGGGGLVTPEYAYNLEAGDDGGGTPDRLRDGHGLQGEDTSFADVVAYGGGYGASEGESAYTVGLLPRHYWYYNASSGGSGGGGGPWDPYDTWPGENQGPPGLAIHGAGGHDGAPGWSESTPNYCGGGGGGADCAGGVQNFLHDQYGHHSSILPSAGGHGVPCDIEGYGEFWELSNHTIRIIPWFGGGGAGHYRMVQWYPAAVEGYGGGGSTGVPGTPNTGGGGGGAGSYQNDRTTDASGPAGGSGRVVIRIRTADERNVIYPPITGIDPETGQPTSSEPHVRITRLDESQPHTDESGDEDCPFN